MEANKTRRAMVLIAHFGKLPEWFDVWLHTAKFNPGIDFHVFQEVISTSQDGNVFFHYMTLKDCNQLPLLKVEGCEIRNPYKFCDYRPLIAELFPEIISPYEYWGWGDLDVIYGDILSIVEPSFNRKFDYVSTGWQGESGPLGFLRNSEQVNRLWRLLPDVHSKLNDEKYVRIDERQFISLLKANDFSCDIVFRECLFDLPARWKDGKLRSLRTDKEYALYHFGGGVPGGRSEMVRKSGPLIRHLRTGGAILVSKKLRPSRRRLITIKYCVTPRNRIAEALRGWIQRLPKLRKTILSGKTQEP
jgi:Family of unknown function (DUF6625)